MPIRLLSLLFLVLALPLFCQQTSMGTRTQQWVWSRGKMMQADTPPQRDSGAPRLQAINHDAGELSALNATLQSELQQLQKGMLSKDLARDLKKVEKLSKKLRQEVAQ
jgi:hypothetical protein